MQSSKKKVDPEEKSLVQAEGLVVVERLHTTRGAQADLGQFLATPG